MSEPSRVLAELGRIDRFFPILSGLGNRRAAARPWEGRTVGLHLHLATLTAEVARVLRPDGRWVVLDMVEHDREEYRDTMGPALFVAVIHALARECA